MCPYYHSLSIDATIVVSKNYQIIGKHVVIIHITLYITTATVWPTKNTLKNGCVNFFSFKVALNPTRRILLNFAKSCILSCLSKFEVRKIFTEPFLKYKRLKLKLMVFWAGYIVAMVTNNNKNTLFHPMITRIYI